MSDDDWAYLLPAHPAAPAASPVDPWQVAAGRTAPAVADPTVTPDGISEGSPAEAGAPLAQAQPASDAPPDAPAGGGTVPIEQRGLTPGTAVAVVMAVANQKGGVGKTTTAVNLGAALAEAGERVLVVDLDPQANATTGVGVDPRQLEQGMYDVLVHGVAIEDVIEPTSLRNLYLAPSTLDLAGAEIELVPAFSRELKLRQALEAVRDDYNYIVIDCPPSLGLLTVNALAAAEELLLPIQCEYYALEGVQALVHNVHLVQRHLNPNLRVGGVLLTMHDARTKLADQVAVEVRRHFGDAVFRQVVPRSVRLSEAPSYGQPIVVFDPVSRGSIAYREVAKEVRQRHGSAS